MTQIPDDNRRTDRRLRIVYVFVTLSVGGAERHLISLLRCIDRERFNPSVLCLGEPGVLADEITKLDIPLHTMRMNSHHLWTPWNQWLLAQWFRSNHFDVVHTHMYHSNCYAGLAACLAGVPIRVFSVHSIKDAERTKRSRLIRHIGRLTHKIIAVSQAVKDSLTLSGCDSERIEIVRNGVEPQPTVSDSERLAIRSELGLPATCPILSIVARMIPLKRHCDLLDALQGLLMEAGPVHLLLVGDGPIRLALEQRACQLGVDQYVHFLGIRNDVERILQITDVAVLCSDHEGMPVSLLEAMAAGVPIVASRVGGIPEIITPTSGILYHAGDVAELRNALSFLVRNPNQRRAMGNAAREQVAMRFTASRMTSQIEQIYINANEPRVIR